jgi:metal-responsive CopG/Arc/MetJ family transcriptional regulator
MITLCHNELRQTEESSMPDASPTISLRLPEEARIKLDRAVKLTRRSRSYLVKAALDRYLADLIREDRPLGGQGYLATLLSLEGKGVRASRPRSREEIDQHIRWLRGNE